MSKFVRQSKVRHLFAQECKPEDTYQNFKLSTATGDHNYIKGNGLYFGVAIQSGNGALAIVSYADKGKQGPQPACLDGHKGPVLDFDFNPFHDAIVCTGGDEGKAMIWGIPPGGLKETQADPLVTLAGHQRKVNVVRFHPAAEHVVATGSADNFLKIWDAEKGLDKTSVEDHPAMILDVVWNYDGSQIVTSCKDKLVRIVDPRSGATVSSCEAHDGTKTTKLEWLGKGTKFCSVGFNRQSKRQLKIWDSKKMDKELSSHDIDQAAGVIMPFYDEDINVLYLAGKGDGNVRYFEIVDEEPYQFYISEYKTTTACRGVAMLPKRVVNTAECEVTRMLKLTTSTVEPIRFVIPRKSELFQSDLFPDCRAPKAAIKADDFFGGKNASPVLMSLDPKHRTDAPAQSSVTMSKVRSAGEIQKELDAALKKVDELEALLKKHNISH
jgi:coronin-1B/1C/6